MRRILFITKGAHAPSSRYRALDYFDLFNDNNWLAIHLADNRSLLRRVAIFKECIKADHVVIVRRTLSWWLLRTIRLLSKQLIFDFDDAIFQKSDGSPSSTRAKRFSAILTSVDQVWAGNSYLAEKAKNYCNKVTILPTSIAKSKYDVESPKPTEHIDLVWIGSSSTRKHLETIIPVLEDLALRIPNLRLKIIADFTIQSSELNIVEIPWNSKTEAEEISSAHIGIAPLPDNAFTIGKCGLKVLQYMASGLPVISSSTGVNKDLVTHGATGFLAESPEEWIEAIEKLATSPELRESMGQAGRQSFQNSFTLEATFQKMAATIK
jgi:glycosyltransferase involved in cell wall biosynthesis